MPPFMVDRITQGATLIFDIEDRFARDRGAPGSHPRPLGKLRFWLVGTMNAGVRTPFPAPWELVVSTGPGGYYVFSDRVIPPSSKTPIRRQLTPARYIVQVRSPWYRMEENINVVIPMPDPNNSNSGAPYTFALEPGYAYPFPATHPVRPNATGNCTPITLPGQAGPTLLRGSLHGAGGKAIPGVRVEVMGPPNKWYVTDDTGQWVLVFDETQSTGPVTVVLTLPDNTVVNIPNVCVIQSCETSLPEIRLPPAVQQYVVK